jgi:hypothetical protein
MYIIYILVWLSKVIVLKAESGSFTVVFKLYNRRKEGEKARI